MIKGIIVGETVDYISKLDTTEPKTVWKISALTAYTFSYIGSKITDTEKSLEAMLEIVSFGLKDVKNFNSFKIETKTINGIQYEAVAKEVLMSIPVPIIIELGAEILKLTNPTNSEIKN